MLDKTIPYYNIIMRLDHLLPKDPCYKAPVGYRIRGYIDGDAERWAELEVNNNDFDTHENAVKYFNSKYLNRIDELEKRFIGVETSDGKLVGAVIAWYEEYNNSRVSAVHWLVIDPNEQSKGLGTYLVMKLIEKFHQFDELPVFLHTQPWSYKAIGIYSKLGFKIMRKETFNGYKNQFEDAIVVLERYMTSQTYTKLVCESI